MRSVGLQPATYLPFSLEKARVAASHSGQCVLRARSRRSFLEERAFTSKFSSPRGRQAEQVRLVNLLIERIVLVAGASDHRLVRDRLEGVGRRNRARRCELLLSDERPPIHLDAFLTSALYYAKQLRILPGSYLLPMIANDHPNALTQLVIKPTVYCYHRCPYCDLRQEYYEALVASKKQDLQQRSANGAARKPNPGHMPLEIALRAIDEAAALGMTSLQLSGGDPLLYPHLIDLIRAGSRHPGVFILMNSVGTGITLDKARQIIGAGLGAWNFSVDTLNPFTYEQLRGIKGALPVVMEAIETVRKAASDWPEFCINYMSVITRQNFRDIPELLIHCIDTGVASLYLMNVYGDKLGHALLTEPEIREFREDIVPTMLAILKKRNLPDIVQTNAVQVLGTFFANDNRDHNYAQGVYWPNLNAAKRACRVPHYYALVEPDGRVLPCCLVEISHKGEVGSVVGQSLAEVWNGDGYTAFRRDRIPFCENCSAPRHKTLGLVPKMCRQFND